MSLIFSLFFMLLASIPLKAKEDVPLTLYGHSTVGEVKLDLSKEQQDWLQQHGKIRVGITTPDYPPFDMTMDGHSKYYEGLSADYLQILSEILKVKIELHFFDSRPKAIDAIKNNDVDMLTTANRYEEFYGLELSQHYVEDIPALYISDKVSPSDTPKRIAIPYDYLPNKQISALFPDAELVDYPSRLQAVAAAAFGQTDSVIIDAFSANHLINNIFSKQLLLKELLSIDTNGISFAFNPEKQKLKEIINSALKQIPISEHWAIKKRWNGGGITVPSKKAYIQFSTDEQTWLAQHKPIRIVVNEFNAPVSYFDQHRNFQGFAADVLEVISLYSGIETVIIRTQSFEEMEKYLAYDSADLAILSPTTRLKNKFTFSKEFTSTPFAVVSHSKTNTLYKQNITVALPAVHTVNELIPKAMPNAKVIRVENYLEAMNAIAKGKVDATIAPLGVADYYINHYYKNILSIDNLVDGIPPAVLAFAATKDNPQLVSILNKILASIPPDELQALENRWRRNAVPGKETWRDYKYTIYTMIAATVMFILAAIYWTWLTRIHYIRRLDAKQEIQNQLLFMQEVVDSIPHPIYVRDIDQQLILCNQSYQHIFKATNKEDILHKSIEEGSHRVIEAHELEKEYRKAIQENRAISRDREIHIDGKAVNIYHWFQPYKNEHGKICGIVGGWIDVSDRVKLMAQLREAKELADSASKAKTQFLATMSHEIRTPMNAIIGLLELAIKRSHENQFDFNSIRVAHDSAKGLLALIGDILDIVKIEAGELTLNPTKIDLKQTISSTIQIFEGIALEKKLPLKLIFDHKLPQYVLLDPLRLKQILSNLISNAIKFTNQGMVTVSAEQQLELNEQMYLLLKVSDTGIGISKDDQQKLFRPFAQVQHGADNKGGTGLGLAICSSLCDMMGGELRMISEPEQGTTLSMRLPLYPVKDIANTMLSPSLNVDTDPPTVLPQHILIVDDHSANRLLLSQQLRYLGHSVDEANNGLEAIQLFRQHPYRIVLTDCNMPIMDGYEFSRRLRQFEQNNNLPAAVVLGYTANAQLEAKQACIDAGMNDCLFKPISLEDLRQKLESYCQKLTLEHPQQAFLPEALTKLTGGNTPLFEQLLKELLNANELDLAELQQAVQQEKLCDAKNIAHKIKGAAKIVAATSVVSACEQFEQIKSVDEIEEKLNNLTIAINTLADEIKNHLAA
ncbi:ATP-binding protein [Shewanella putrefaciens]|uniref:ATP-binding protein n=2 Tax=Shewanella putrefaciens TaxID=24 RepID=UPI001427BFA7|nr:transporter substrate-binding domain-containing protein [Shewanella putrefaciens]